MSKPLAAGTAYFAIAFTLGFALGSLRVLFVEPRLGPLGAVLVEMPIMLMASWVVCRWLIDRLSIRTPAARLAMGAWGAVQASCAGVAIAIGGALRDFISGLAADGSLGPALTGPATGYGAVYQFEIFLLFATLVVIGPLVRSNSTDLKLSSRFGLAEFPG